MLELVFSDGSTKWRPQVSLEAMPQGQDTIEDRLLSIRFGGARNLQQVITHEKLKGSLHEVIYSMEAAQIDFYPYQFKPVMKLIDSPTERLLIADEVGLGKTIEAALIWLELQARRQAKRLLVVCPKTLAEKWKEELRQKFLLDARLVDFRELRDEVARIREEGPSHAFILIATYSGLRPPRPELRLLDQPIGEGSLGSEKTEFLRWLRHDTPEFEPFDLIIFDEAHYMRNRETTTFHLGEALCAAAEAVLCVSATPVNNSNKDLHSLLRLIDQDFLESEGMFEDLLEANRPAVLASNTLQRLPVDMKVLRAAVERMEKSKLIHNLPHLKSFKEAVFSQDLGDRMALARCQATIEKLNLLGLYINRTRRVQVKEHRPVRDPHVLAVQYTQEEMRLYDMILKLVRQRCRRDSRPFHVFQVLGLQLRTASCLPVLAKELREGEFGDPADLLEESFGGEGMDDLFEELDGEDLPKAELAELLRYDFEAHDSKYRELRRLLTEQVTDEKVIVFGYYRPTLEYLRRRLLADDIKLAIIHGGIPQKQRAKELQSFAEATGPRVLLSSEVGSEGIDLQFCRVLVNYDLPWNPMRVEQRIGRIDRVGQTAAKLAIVNFKVRDTVEERLYDRLHQKLARFENSLGNLEAVVGQEVQQLTIDILSKDLTPEQEQERIQLSEQAIANQVEEINRLEESGDVLVALADYLQKQIEETRGKGRYVQAEELEDYLHDFFDRQFPGCAIDTATPQEGCIQLHLSPEAHASLSSYVQNDRSLSARPYRQRKFCISFRREVMQRLPREHRRSVHFANHLCPLIRWITKINRESSYALNDVSALVLEESRLPQGIYCYRIERWKLNGLLKRERLAYAVASVDNQSVLREADAESVVQVLLREGKDWDYPVVDRRCIDAAHQILKADLSRRFDGAVEEFGVDDATALQMRERRICGFYDRRIAQDERRLETLRSLGRSSRVIKATEGRIRTSRENRETRLAEIRSRARIDLEMSPIAAGVFLVKGD